MSSERPNKAMQRLCDLPKPVHEVSFHPLVIQKYVGRSNQSEKSGISQPPFVVGPCTWGLLKATITGYNYLMSQFNSPNQRKMRAL